MNAEQIEHELNNRRGAEVSVVRPGYGTQSDSWTGILSVGNRNAYPMIFQVQSPLSATIFCADDVTNVDDIDDHNGGPKLLIRLKGPEDYRNRLTPVKA